METKKEKSGVTACGKVLVAGTSLDVSSDILRSLQRALLSGALQACSTPLQGDDLIGLSILLSQSLQVRHRHSRSWCIHQSGSSLRGHNAPSEVGLVLPAIGTEELEAAEIVLP